MIRSSLIFCLKSGEVCVMYLFKMISCVRFLADTYMQFQDTWIILNTYLQLSPSLRKNMYVFLYVRCFCGPSFPAFALNTEIYRLDIRILSKCEKMQTRKTSNTDTFNTVLGAVVMPLWLTHLKSMFHAQKG